MAERKATNKYYPPDWDPSKGSVNRHKKSHPLRARARKIDEGILVVRFEMPFNIWCQGCNNHIGMGVRFNAEKSKVGAYYSTPIYKFRMKCHLCDNFFEIQTDPGKLDYSILSGARKQVRISDSDERDLDQHNEDAKRRMVDAMYRLEKKVEDKIENEARLPGLHDLKRWKEKFEDSFSINQLVRSRFREQRKIKEKTKANDRDLLRKTCLKIPLVSPCPSDTIMARDIITRSRKDKLVNLEEQRKREILSSDLALKKNLRSSSSKIKPSSKTQSKQTRDSRLTIKIKRDPG